MNFKRKVTFKGSWYSWVGLICIRISSPQEWKPYSFHFPLFFLLFWTAALSVFSSICTSVSAQESRISHSERRALKLLFNHFQSMLWDSKCWHSGPGLGSRPGIYCRAQWACSVICHCKGRRKWLHLSERIQFHPTITSLLCLQIFSQRKKGWLHMLCRISAFYRHHCSSNDRWTKCFRYLLELQAMKCNPNYSWNMQFGWNVILVCVWVMHLRKGCFDTPPLLF